MTSDLAAILGEFWREMLRGVGIICVAAAVAFCVVYCQAKSLQKSKGGHHHG